MSCGAVWMLRVINVRPFNATLKVKVAPHSGGLFCLITLPTKQEALTLSFSCRMKKTNKKNMSQHNEPPKWILLQLVVFFGKWTKEKTKTMSSIRQASEKHPQAGALTSHPLQPNETFPFASTIRFDIWAAIPIEQFVLSQQGQVEECLSRNAVLSFDNSEHFSIHILNAGHLGDLSVVFTLFMHPEKTGISSSFQLQLISS